MERRPPPCPIRDLDTCFDYAIARLDERHHTAQHIRESPLLLGSHQPRLTSTMRQTDEFDLDLVMQSNFAAARTFRRRDWSRDRGPRNCWPVNTQFTFTAGEADKHLARTRRFGLHQGFLDLCAYDIQTR